MEDVSFGAGEIVFVDEFDKYASVGRSLRLIGRLIQYDPAKQIAWLADPNDDAKKIAASTTLLTQVKPSSDDNIVALLGEVKRSSDGQLYFQPRVFANSALGMEYDVFRAMVIKRREQLLRHNFTS